MVLKEADLHTCPHYGLCLKLGCFLPADCSSGRTMCSAVHSSLLGHLQFRDRASFVFRAVANGQKPRRRLPRGSPDSRCEALPGPGRLVSTRLVSTARGATRSGHGVARRSRCGEAKSGIGALEFERVDEQIIFDVPGVLWRKCH